MRLEIEFTDEPLATHSGLSLIGEMLARTRLETLLNALKGPGFLHSDQ